MAVYGSVYVPLMVHRQIHRQNTYATTQKGHSPTPRKSSFVGRKYPETFLFWGGGLWVVFPFGLDPVGQC